MAAGQEKTDTSQSPQADGVERRIAPRRRVLKRARIVFNHGFSTIDAMVRNISDSGALLTVDESVQLPKTFDISVAEGPKRPAKLVYRRTMFAGIRFLDIEEQEAHRASDAEEARIERASPAPAPVPASGIRRIEPEPLPAALTANLLWKV